MKGIITIVSIPCKRESTCARNFLHNHNIFHRHVSIPCKRESTCARIMDLAVVNTPPVGFHSLQTGKHMCTTETDTETETHPDRFHSLQTGKHMCTKTKLISGKFAEEQVSIPCKRESTCAP